jgi:hypothetical protein
MYQKGLETLSLLTDGDCGTQTDGIIDLIQFCDIRSFTWRGINRRDHFMSLARFIENNVTGLVTLALDFVSWNKVEKTWRSYELRMGGNVPQFSDNFFARKVLGIQPGGERGLFRSLKNLFLSSVSFGAAVPEMIYAFNLSNLKTLTLRNCPYSLELLKGIVKNAHSLRLKSFELVIGLECRCFELEVAQQYDIVARVLKSFSGLEDLSLMLEDLHYRLTPPRDWDATLVEGVLNHYSTLKRLVIHTGPSYLGLGGYIEEGDDDIPWSEQRDDLYRSGTLNCIGTTGLPSKLVSPYRALLVSLYFNVVEGNRLNLTCIPSLSGNKIQRCLT